MVSTGMLAAEKKLVPIA